MLWLSIEREQVVNNVPNRNNKVGFDRESVKAHLIYIYTRARD